MPKGEYLQYGGQALIEGVMMRSPRFYSIACRAPSGQIVLHCEPMEKTWIGRQKWLKLPFLRGSFGILDALTLGSKAMKFASHVQMEPEYEKHIHTDEGEKQELVNVSPGAHKASSAAITTTLIIGLMLGLFLFSAVPNVIAEFASKLGVTSPIVKNLISEIVKITLFLAYVGLIGLMPDIRRVFQFHGAEHKAINVIENDLELGIENASKQSRLHPRCGTSFAIIVLILSLLFFTFVPRYPLGESANKFANAGIRVMVELVLLPLVAGVAYEALRIAGKFRNQLWVKFAFAPGLATQYLTTREPDAEHTEVAVAALKAVLDAEEAQKQTTLPSESVA